MPCRLTLLRYAVRLTTAPLARRLDKRVGRNDMRLGMPFRPVLGEPGPRSGLALWVLTMRLAPRDDRGDQEANAQEVSRHRDCSLVWQQQGATADGEQEHNQGDSSSNAHAITDWSTRAIRST